MTEDELAEIEERYAKNAPIFGIEPDIPALLAEVRRLRAFLGAIPGQNLEHAGDMARAALRGETEIPDNHW